MSESNTKMSIMSDRNSSVVLTLKPVTSDQGIQIDLMYCIRGEDI